MTRIMFHLDRAAKELAEQFSHDISIDFYQTVYFKSGRFHTEWGEMPLYGLTLGGEGGHFEEDQFEEAVGILNAEMEKTCPEFLRLQAMMVARFGEIVVELEYSEI